MGESLVKIDAENETQIFVINSTCEDVEINLPLIEVEEFEVLLANTIRSIKQVFTLESNKSRMKLQDRIEVIKRLLKTGDLNVEERNSVERLVEKYPYQFFVEGDKLGYTDVIMHKIRTKHEKPINIKQYRQSQILQQEAQR